MSTDFLQRFMFEHIPVRGCLVRLENSWQEVLRRARPGSEVSEILGQSLCAAAVLGSSIKFAGTVSLQVQTSGRLRLLLGQCSEGKRVRGIARMNTELEPQTDLLLDPVLAINLEPDEGGTPYQGIVSMEDGDLSRALELYFAQSEQLESRFWLVANDSTCAAFMLQRMPGERLDEDDFARIIHLTSTLQDHELHGTDPAQLLHLLFNEDTVRLFDAEPLEFGCKCSLQRVAGVLQSLGQEEMESLLQEQGRVEVSCEYCGQDYRFDQVDIAGIFSDPRFRVEGPPGLH